MLALSVFRQNLQGPGQGPAEGGAPLSLHLLRTLLYREMERETLIPRGLRARPGLVVDMGFKAKWRNGKT